MPKVPSSVLLKKLFGLSTFLFFIFSLQAQTDDNIIWASLKLKQRINTKNSIAVAPILRLNDNVSDYQNWSIDYSLRHKINTKLSVQLLGRTWFIPDQKGRQFIWLDVQYAHRTKDVKISSFVRWHNALDINDRKDPDYIRWKSVLGLRQDKKLRAFIGLEPWLRLNGAGNLQRFRIEPGIQWIISKNMDFVAMYRRENRINVENGPHFNMYVVTVAYALN